jgi:hypothetical protein
MKPTLDNIDQWLFDAMEGNLSPVQQQLLEEFIAQHPDLDLEAEAWSLSTYSAAPITFEPKAALYRKSESLSSILPPAQQSCSCSLRSNQSILLKLRQLHIYPQQSPLLNLLVLHPTH